MRKKHPLKTLDRTVVHGSKVTNEYINLKSSPMYTTQFEMLINSEYNVSLSETGVYSNYSG